MTESECAGCCADSECECRKECDEGDYCEKHMLEEHTYWERYFGRYGSNARLVMMSQRELTETMAEARRLK